MKKIAAILLAAAPLWLTGCISIQKTTSSATATPTAWEYKIIRAPQMPASHDSTNVWNNLDDPAFADHAIHQIEADDAFQQNFLNQLGKDGWILINVENSTYYLKRPMK